MNLIEKLAKSGFFIKTNKPIKTIKCEDGAQTSIVYSKCDEDFPEVSIRFQDYGTTESDFSAMLETLIEESIRNLGEEETKKIITKLVKEWLE